MVEGKHLCIAGWCWATPLSGHCDENWHPKLWHRIGCSAYLWSCRSHSDNTSQRLPTNIYDVGWFMAPRWLDGGEPPNDIWLHKVSHCHMLPRHLNSLLLASYRKDSCRECVLLIYIHYNMTVCGIVFHCKQSALNVSVFMHTCLQISKSLFV